MGRDASGRVRQCISVRRALRHRSRTTIRPASGQERVDEPSFSPRCRDVGANGGAVDAIVATVRHDLDQRDRYGIPDPGLAQAPKPPVTHIPVAVFGRHVAPCRAAAKPPEYPVDNRTVVFGLTTAPSVFWINRQQGAQNTPFRYAQIAPAQPCLPKGSLASTVQLRVNRFVHVA